MKILIKSFECLISISELIEELLSVVHKTLKAINKLMKKLK